ncbi:MAG: DUF1553 domain-containing protein [Planctomycetaceae bacterium]|nr:DUF1553 domain-containing protein [Planctomycetaceae bacterium]
MTSSWRILWCAGLSSLLALLASTRCGHSQEREASTDVAVDYQRDVEPILSKHCLACHGPDRDASGLRVDRWKSLLEGGEYGVPAIVPGQPESSFLLHVVDGTSDDLAMPPEGNDPLTSEQVEVLRRWIAGGALVPDSFRQSSEDPKRWWSLQPISPPIVPESRSAIDYLIEAKLHENDLSLSQPADRVTLIRRLYLVMLGLPPSPSEVKTFVNDSEPEAWERLVDRVLASPHYGERWARHWLDVARFGETDGYETNRERPNAWRYRDWVIEAFNRDMPYTDFVRNQIAGDALGEPIGTSFLVGGPHDIVKSPDPLLTLTQRQDELTDMVATVGSAFLGLTIGCARCHNHKFDPITQTDFYAMQAIFSGVHHGESPLPEHYSKTAIEQAAIDAEFQQWQHDVLTHYRNQVAGTIVWPAVDATFNIEVFEPQPARMVRFSIQATNASEPCLDELEIFAGQRQVGLAAMGGVASSSGNYPNNPKHQLDHIHDGRYGNDYSWISDTPGAGWVQIAWAEPVAVDRIHWGRDRKSEFADRLATTYTIELSLDGQTWTTVAGSQHRLPLGSREPSLYDQVGVHVSLAASQETFGQRLNRIRQRYQQLAGAAMAFCGTFSQPPTINKLFRGDPLSPREEVAPDFLEILGGLELGPSASDQERRLALANALVRDDNPLLARVIVNRIWQYHFGTGIVETASDFGRNAASPSHPELLDWLAARLRQHDWSLKALHRELLLSRTWQQSSLPHENGLQRDAGGRLLWRFPPRRLEAEIIRDQILATSGALQHSGGGPGFSAFVVEMENVRHYHPLESYGPEHYRRMIYQTKVRQEQDAVFGAFDCPDGTQIAPQRSRSTTPLQAMNLFNSGFVQQQAEMMARRLQESGVDLETQIQLAFDLTYSRVPAPDELDELRRFTADQGLPALCRVLFNSNEFLFIH